MGVGGRNAFQEWEEDIVMGKNWNLESQVLKQKSIYKKYLSLTLKYIAPLRATRKVVNLSISLSPGLNPRSV